MTLAALLLAAAVAGAPEEPPALHGSIAIFPFANATGEVSLYWLGQAFALGVAEGMDAAGFTTVDGPARQQAAVELGLQGDDFPLASAMLVARRLGATQIVVGRVERSGDHDLEVEASLLSTTVPGILGSAQVQGRVSEIYALEKRLAAQMVRPLEGPSRLPSVHGPWEKLERVPLTAYESYVKALVATEIDRRRALLDRALEIDPRFPAALLEQARLDLAEGRPQAALVRLDRIQPEDAPLPERYWMLRAEASAEAGDRGSALDAFQASIAIRPRPEAHFGAAALLAQAGRLEDARRHVEAGLALDPQSIEGRDLDEALTHRPQAPE